MDITSTPKITIITPSYNQAAFIEQTIRSVQEQDYPYVQHIVVDGSSSDETILILRRYGHLMWISEKDRGQADALNKGLALATGDIIGWINSDDYYEKDIFQTVAAFFSDPSIQWLVGNVIHTNSQGTQKVRGRSPEISYERLLRNPDIVRQQATFFRRTLLDRVGGWNPELFMVMDFDLWVRLAKIAPPKMVDKDLAYFRIHALQKSRPASVRRQTRELCSILNREGVSGPAIARLYLRKRWELFKSHCRLPFVSLGILEGGETHDVKKHATG